MTNAPQDVDDTARRDRLDVAMSTRAARWCLEVANEAVDLDRKRGGRGRPLGTAAYDMSCQYATGLVRAVYVRGDDPSEPWHVDDSWKYRALVAWSHLEMHQRYPDWPVDTSALNDVAELEAADAAVTWQLRSERPNP